MSLDFDTGAPERPAKFGIGSPGGHILDHVRASEFASLLKQAEPVGCDAPRPRDPLALSDGERAALAGMTPEAAMLAAVSRFAEAS